MLTVNQPLYIRSAAAINPRQGEPDYRALLDPRLIRRMSRIIRMGAAAALAGLREAGVSTPDAIVTGTAYGCMEDTGLFLNSLIERNEETLQPATFIQSTHNTVGAQVALLLGCTGYNNTFVHRGFSFESALLDAALLLADKEARSVLVGGVDELTETSRALLTRLGLFRRAVAGEGAAFFLLTDRPSGADLARLDGFHRFYKPAMDEDVKMEVNRFLRMRGLEPSDIDLVITGDNGEERGDRIYREIRASLFPGKPTLAYKDRCGEYPTSTSFALWLAAQEVRSGSGRVLVYNNYLGIYHSVYLLSDAAK
jgi:3-oxoacyl-[acyl-carrier-protein] synthase II